MFIKTDYSMFKSALTVKESMKLAVKNELDTVVLCDDNLSGCLEFYHKAKDNKLKPIFGLSKIIKNVEYLFIAHNYNGYTKLTTADTLKNYDFLFNTEDITVIAINIVMNEDIPEINILCKYSSLIKEKNIFDVHKNNILKEKTVLPIRIANGKSEDDIFKICAMECINPDATILNLDQALLETKARVSLINTKEEINSSKELLEILNNCVDDYKFGNPVPPEFIFGKELGAEYGLVDPDNDTLFEHICREGLKFRLNNIPNKEYEDRLELEMNVIKKMKFSGYMLIVFDFINYAKRCNIPVGPGRGSAAGSLVCYSLLITNIDPIPYNLLFERFLNPERVSLPDIDLDFCRDRRIEVINYVIEKYGKERVAQVITFGKLGAKSGVKDITRILSKPISLGENLSKLISDAPGTTCEIAYNENKEAFDKKLSEDFYAKEVWNYAVNLEGFKKNLGVHAAGLVISNDNIYNRAPMNMSGEVGIVGYDGKYLEDVNLVKYDFLGLKTLTVIDNAVKCIKRDLNIDIDPYNLPRDDKNVYDFISEGNTFGMFQIESDGMQDLAKRLKPSNFEDIIAMLALYRPGPMEAGMLESFINRKHGREEIDYFFKEMEPLLKPILEPTYGLIVYQEQVMQIVQAIAGFSLGEADLVRRAMGKKKPEEMAKISKDFIERSAKKGFNPKDAETLFVLIEKFAGYGFNKSHSAAYALVTYVTAYIKYYYPASFMANLINSELDNISKIGKLIKEAKKMNILVNNPNVLNGSTLFESNENKKEIIFGLSGAKTVGKDSSLILNAVKKFDQKISFIDLMKYLQRDIKKEIDKNQSKTKKLQKTNLSLTKKSADNLEKNQNIITKYETKMLKANPQLRKEELNIIVTDKVNSTIQKRLAENKNIEMTINNNNAEIATLEKELVVLNKEFEENGAGTKVNKTTIETLGKIGAFEPFGVTRYDIINNIEKLLDYNKIDSIEFTNKEISNKEKIAFEIEFLGIMLTEPFDYDIVNQHNIPEGFFVGVIVNIEERSTKKQKPYLKFTFLTSKDEIFEMNDFNGKIKNPEIGNNVIIQFSYNESGFKNILRYIDFSIENLGSISFQKEEQQPTNYYLGDINLNEVYNNSNVNENLNNIQNNDNVSNITEMTIKILSNYSIPDSVKTINVLDVDDSLLMVIER